jgi:hypothetical protein
MVEASARFMSFFFLYLKVRHKCKFDFINEQDILKFSLIEIHDGRKPHVG